MLTMMAGALVGLALVQQTDTVIPVRPDARLQVSGLGGEVVIRTWNRNELRVVADHSSRDRIEITARGSYVKIEAKTRMGAPRQVDYNITIPATMDVELGGTYMDIDVEGVRGTVNVETVQGDVRVVGGSRFITAHSVQGDVDVIGARGRVDAQSVNGEVTVLDAAGDVRAETVNGEIRLERITSPSVEAATVNGEIVYDGTIENNGRYWFNTHNGDVVVTIPRDASVTVSVSTFNGDFESDFPVTLTHTRAKRFSFTIGGGSARLELESFGGTIRLVRPGGR